MWCPPWTRQMAASSSSTRALVLKLLCFKLNAIALIESCFRITIFSPCFVFMMARRQRIHTWMSSFASPIFSFDKWREVRLFRDGGSWWSPLLLFPLPCPWLDPLFVTVLTRDGESKDGMRLDPFEWEGWWLLWWGPPEEEPLLLTKSPSGDSEDLRFDFSSCLQY